MPAPVPVRWCNTPHPRGSVLNTWFLCTCRLLEIIMKRLERFKNNLHFFVLALAVAGLLSWALLDTASNTLSQQGLIEGLHRQDIVLVDVRNDWEFERDRIPSSINIPHQNIITGIPALLEQVDAQATLVLYCETGVRSRITQRILQKRGYKNVLRLEGDISRWREAQLPLHKGAHQS